MFGCDVVADSTCELVVGKPKHILVQGSDNLLFDMHCYSHHKMMSDKNYNSVPVPDNKHLRQVLERNSLKLVR